jgi:hypothetical protein
MPRFGATGISRKLTIVAAGSVLCVAAAGTSAAAGPWLGSKPTAPVIRAADAAFLHSVSGVNSLEVRPGGTKLMRPGRTKQALIVETARRIAYTKSAGAAAAARAAARRAAAAAAAARQAASGQASAGQASAEQAGTQQAGAQQAAQPAARQSPAGSPQQIAQQLLGQYGWAGEFSCLDSLWTLESGWNTYAENPTTGAYGIPQALPGSKMASAGPDWQSDPATQIRWGLSYIQASYGSPCAAWSHEEAVGWY